MVASKLLEELLGSSSSSSSSSSAALTSSSLSSPSSQSRGGEQGGILESESEMIGNHICQVIGALCKRIVLKINETRLCSLLFAIMEATRNDHGEISSFLSSLFLVFSLSFCYFLLHLHRLLTLPFLSFISFVE